MSNKEPKYRHVPLVLYSGENRILIGYADVYPNGHIKAQVSVESAERIGLAGELSTLSVGFTPSSAHERRRANRLVEPEYEAIGLPPENSKLDKPIYKKGPIQ